MGLVAVIFSFLVWGLIPIYWKLMEEVDAMELLAYRVIGATLVAFVLVGLRNEFRAYRKEMSSFRGALFQFGSALFLGINWYTFVWAIINDRILDASLGYYLSPFVTIALGQLFGKDRLNVLQWTAVGLVAFGTAVQFLLKGNVPLPAVIIAGSWGCYGLFKNKNPVSAYCSLAAEGTFLTPLSLIFLIVAGQRTGIALGSGDASLDALLYSTGIVVSIPMLSYGFGARRVSLLTLSMAQYLGPTVTLLVAVFIYNEPFGTGKSIAFFLIWIGITVYIVDAFRQRP